MSDENASQTPPTTTPPPENKVTDMVAFGSSNSCAKLFEALAKAQGEMKPAVLDMKNPHYNSVYASLTSVMESIKAPFAKHGLCVSQQVFSIKDGFFIRTLLGHSSGEYMTNVFRLIIDRQNMQGLGSAITYARRYGICALAGVVDTEDDDGNAAVGGKAEGGKEPQKPQSPPPGKPKNFAPPSRPAQPPAKDPNDLDAALSGPPKTYLDQLVEIMEAQSIPPEEMKEIVFRVIGQRKSSNQMTNAEIQQVIKYLEMTKGNRKG